jgi:hypothetical protein
VADSTYLARLCGVIFFANILGFEEDELLEALENRRGM